MEQITYYFQGKLTEDEALQLWEHLLIHPYDIELIDFYSVLCSYWSPKKK